MTSEDESTNLGIYGPPDRHVLTLKCFLKFFHFSTFWVGMEEGEDCKQHKTRTYWPVRPPYSVHRGEYESNALKTHIGAFEGTYNNGFGDKHGGGDSRSKRAT